MSNQSQIKAQIKLKREVIDRQCQICGYIFTQRCHLLRHLKKQHKFKTKSDNVSKSQLTNANNEIVEVLISLKEQMESIKEEHNQQIKIMEEKQNQQMKMLEEKHIESFHNITQNIEQLKERANITNNILQVVCLTQNDNYLDMLTEELGDFNKALNYIKCCALSNINGDCQLIERIYLNSNVHKPSFHYLNRSKTKIEYFDEKKNLQINKKEEFCRKLANNLQNTYLKGINHVISDNLENKRCPNKFLEEYDVQTWNQHIYNLSDLSYQKKIMNQLNVPDCDKE